MARLLIEAVLIIALVTISVIAFRLKCRSRLLKEKRVALEVQANEYAKELKKSAKKLKEEARERTKELEARIDELEKFHRLTVGRELKMIELKKEIEKLKTSKKK